MKTVEEIRVARLEQLIQEMGGSIQKVADQMGKTHSQISQLKNMARHSTTGKPRVIGSDLAREFEAKFGKPPGWMDHEETGGAEAIGSDGSQAERWRQAAIELAEAAGNRRYIPAKFLLAVDFHASSIPPAEPVARSEYVRKLLEMVNTGSGS